MDLWVVDIEVDKVAPVAGNFVQEDNCSHTLEEVDNDAGSSHFVEEADSFLEAFDILHCIHKADNNFVFSLDYNSQEEAEARNSVY